VVAATSSGCATLDFLPDLFTKKQAVATSSNPQIPPPSTQQFSQSSVRDQEPELSIASVQASRQVTSKSVPEAPADYVDVWDTLRETQGLAVVSNARVQHQIERYQKHKKTLERISTNATPYLHFIATEVRRRQLPSELALIPVIESGFRPRARSPSGASGLWQFIASTGRRYNLAQNWWYDGRRDVTASTVAAFDYLEYLERKFDGDWLLAIAAYNAGEGTVGAAIKRNRANGKPTDYWSLDVPKETKMYVPRLLAVAQIVKQPDLFGFELKPIKNVPYFREVEPTHQIELALVAHLAGIDMDEVRALNPGYKQWATPPEGPHRILVPSARAEHFVAALARLPPEQHVTWNRHEIKPGDTLGAIASRYHTTVTALQKINNLKDTRIRAGRTLIVPATGSSTNESGKTLATLGGETTTVATGDKFQYIVRSGDSLWVIARRHDTTVKKLAAWNNITRNATLRLGQRLEIRPPMSVAEPSDATQVSQDNETNLVHYTVTRGDSLWEISRRFGVSVVALRKWNQLPRGQLLQPGQTLNVYVGELDQARL